MRRGILGVVGGRIVRAERVACRLRPIRVSPAIASFRRRVTGQRVEEVGRVGKRVVLHLGNQDVVVFEPRMTGLVLVSDPPNRAHLRFRIELKHCAARELMFWDRRGLGSVTLFDRREFGQALGPDRLGPDAMRVTADLLKERLQSSRRAVKVALLDQRAIAGIGNLYASEILHVARVHPAATCDRLSGRQWMAVAKATVAVLAKAIECEGSTLSDGTYRNALNQPGRYQNEHRVYDREATLCLTCQRRRIVRTVQAQRSTFFCPYCQRPPKR